MPFSAASMLPQATIKSPSNSNAPREWQLEDLIDFDFALESASKSGKISDHQHREAFLQFQKENDRNGTKSNSTERSKAFRYWLDKQRQRPPLADALPGQLFCRGIRTLRTLIYLAALLSGTLMTAALLRYDGTQPTNVAGFLSLLLGGQLVLLAATGAGFLLRRFGIIRWESGIIAPGIHFCLNRCVKWIQQNVQEKSSAESRLRMQAFLGSVTRKHSHYQAIILGILSTLLQSFGIWFNVAAVATTLFLVTVSDRAFGWQSSLNLSSQEIHHVTQRIASPWSFILPSIAPTITEIEGSRIFLKDGIKTLANQNLVSWWPFLACSLLVYGFAPRFLLWLGSHWFVRNRLNQIRFDSLTCDRLWESMNKQELRTSGSALGKPENPPPPLEMVALQEAPPMSEEKKEEPYALVIVEPELAKRSSQNKIDTAIHELIGWTVSRWIKLPDETQSSAVFWEQVEPIRNEASFERIVLIQEAFQPPIRETIAWIKELRATQAPNGKMMIYLVGRPKEAGRRQEVCETNHQVWTQSVDALHDNNLAVSLLEIIDDNE